MSVDESTTAKTVRVRIPVVIDENSNWFASGWGYDDGEPQEACYGDLTAGLPKDRKFADLHYVVAEIPVAARDIQGTVEGDR